MTKQNKTLPYANKASVGKSNRATSGIEINSMYIPGTKIPRDFYITVKYDTQKLLDAPVLGWEELLTNEFRVALSSAKEIIRDFRQRHRVFKYCGADPGKGFKTDYNYAWCTTDDGVIQLLRLDMIPLGERAIDAEMDWLDGKLEEVFEDGIWVLKPVEK